MKPFTFTMFRSASESQLWLSVDCAEIDLGRNSSGTGRRPDLGNFPGATDNSFELFTKYKELRSVNRSNPIMDNLALQSFKAEEQVVDPDRK
jgi:hypothetical protein